MIGSIINILIGLGLIIAAASGNFVFKGTDSSALLGLLGAAVCAYGLYGVARRSGPSGG